MMKRLFALLLASTITTSCTWVATPPRTATVQSASVLRAPVPVVPETTIEVLPIAPLPVKQETLWEGLVAHRALPQCNDSNTQRYMRIIGRSPALFIADLERVTPFLAYVYEEARARGLPSEAAILPFVESGYRQDQGRGPRGWWQLMDMTARKYGLTVDGRTDERLRPIRATAAALNMLLRLKGHYDDNFLLALIAYNRGPARLDSVLRRKRLDPAQISSLDGLESPTITVNHIAKIQAYGCLIADALANKTELPEVHSYTPHRFDHALPLQALASVFGDDFAEWRRQHPAFVSAGQVPAGTEFLAPPTTETVLAALDMSQYPLLAQVSPSPGMPSGKGGSRVHTVSRGDNLWTLARRYGLRVREILSINPHLNSRRALQLGQQIHLP